MFPKECSGLCKNYFKQNCLFVGENSSLNVFYSTIHNLMNFRAVRIINPVHNKYIWRMPYCTVELNGLDKELC